MEKPLTPAVFTVFPWHPGLIHTGRRSVPPKAPPESTPPEEAPPEEAPPGGFEPPTCGLEVRCSIQLSYRGNRGDCTVGRIAAERVVKERA